MNAMKGDFLLFIERTDGPINWLQTIWVDMLIKSIIDSQLRSHKSYHRKSIDEWWVKKSNGIRSTLGCFNIRTDSFILVTFMFGSQEVVNSKSLLCLVINPGNNCIRINHIGFVVVFSKTKSHVLSRINSACQLHYDVISIHDPSKFKSEVVIKDFTVDLITCSIISRYLTVDQDWRKNMVISDVFICVGFIWSFAKRKTE